MTESCVSNNAIDSDGGDDLFDFRIEIACDGEVTSDHSKDDIAMKNGKETYQPVGADSERDKNKNRLQLDPESEKAIKHEEETIDLAEKLRQVNEYIGKNGDSREKDDEKNQLIDLLSKRNQSRPEDQKKQNERRTDHKQVDSVLKT